MDLCEDRGERTAQIVLRINRAELCVARGDFDGARAICDETLGTAEKVGDTRSVGEINKHYGIIFRESGDPQRSEYHLARAARIAEESGDLLLGGEANRELAELYRTLGKSPQVLASLNRAHGMFAELRARRQLADLDRRTAEFRNLFVTAASQWSESIEAADLYTRGHCDRVARYACALARATEIDEETLFWFHLGALLHDVGKIVVPKAILNKPGVLTPEERALIEQHPDAGVELLGEIDFPWDVRPMLRHHHERWDGGGYPSGLEGEEIPIAARILCIADVYDALTSDRPYRTGFSSQRALEIMREGMRGHFDPSLFTVFCELIERGLEEDAAAPARAEPAAETMLVSV